jgi:hypothetical protein
MKDFQLYTEQFVAACTASLLIDRYFVDKEVLYRKASHLWVLTPDNLDDLLGLDR